MSTLAWPLLLLALAVILFIAEVFIPSGGVIGILAVGVLGLSLWQAFYQSIDLGLKFLAADFILMPLVIASAFYLWPKTPLARLVFLKPPGPEEISVSHSAQRLDHLIGEIGRTLTPMRPSGMVDFDGRRLDGLSEDGLIPTGTLVMAVAVRSGQLVVRTAPESRFTEKLEMN